MSFSAKYYQYTAWFFGRRFELMLKLFRILRINHRDNHATLTPTRVIARSHAIVQEIDRESRAFTASKYLLPIQLAVKLIEQVFRLNRVISSQF